jgi:predicted secreted protein
MGRAVRSGGALSTAMALAIGIALAIGAAGCSAPQSSTTASSRAGGVVEQYGGSAAMKAAAPSVAPDAATGPVTGLGAGTGADAASVPAAQRLIVRNKTMRIEVAAVNAAIDRIRAMASRDGADITQMQVATATDEQIYRPMVEGDVSSTTGTALRAYVTIRVPAAKYQAFIDEAAKLGTVQLQTETTDDVTQQHIDLSARLDNLKVEELRLRDFFAKAKNVTEMLQIEQELSRVRGEIESMAAQVAYLERQAAMATVTVELTEPKPLVRPSGIDWGVGTAFTDSIRAFVGTLNVLIVMLGPILALGVFVVLPALLIARFVWRRVGKRRAARDAAAGDAGTDAPAQQ